MDRWFRGNTHAHSTRSDGDLPPDEVVEWFRGHGYDFVCITDHFVASEPGFAESRSDKDFLVIPGQELTTLAGGIPVHVNALGTEVTTPEPKTGDVGDVLGEMVRLARTKTEVVSINHPNFYAAFTAEEMMRIPDPFLLEIFNGHPQVFNEGWPGRPSVEAMWDALLTAGKQVYGVACDDSHHYLPEVRRPAPSYAAPGLGWVCVRAEDLTAQGILDSLLHGRFYASTGVELSEVGVESGEYQVEAAPGMPMCKFQFVGSGGAILSEGTGSSAVFNMEGVTGYVRVRVVGERGKMAWTQPVFLPE
jgi:hypothetical protein